MRFSYSEFNMKYHLTNVKGPHDNKDVKGVVYCIPCECGAKYNGETARPYATNKTV